MQKKFQKKYLYIFLIVTVVVLSLIFIKNLISARQYSKVPPQIGELTEAVYSLGKVKSNQKYEVKLGVTSTVQKVYIKEGDSVVQGQSLIELDTKTTFKAPFAGTVTFLNVHEKETVSPQAIILRLENLKDRHIELSLEQEGALRIKSGQLAKISFESLRGEVLTGKVKSIFPKEDDFIANIEVTNLPENILPGMSADVAIEIGKISGTLIPLKAIRNGFITLEKNGRKEKIKVEVGLSDGISAEIKSPKMDMSDLIWIPRN